MPESASAATSKKRLLCLTVPPLAAAAAIAAWPEEAASPVAIAAAPAATGTVDRLVKRADRLLERDPAGTLESWADETRDDPVAESISPFAVASAPEFDQLDTPSPAATGREEPPAEAAERPLPSAAAFVTGGGSGAAWVAGRRVTVGDTVDGWVVVAVDAAGVHVRPAD